MSRIRSIRALGNPQRWRAVLAPRAKRAPEDERHELRTTSVFAISAICAQSQPYWHQNLSRALYAALWLHPKRIPLCPPRLTDAVGSASHMEAIV